MSDEQNQVVGKNTRVEVNGESTPEVNPHPFEENAQPVDAARDTSFDSQPVDGSRDTSLDAKPLDGQAALPHPVEENPEEHMGEEMQDPWSDENQKDWPQANDTEVFNDPDLTGSFPVVPTEEKKEGN